MQLILLSPKNNYFLLITSICVQLNTKPFKVYSIYNCGFLPEPLRTSVVRCTGGL